MNRAYSPCTYPECLPRPLAWAGIASHLRRLGSRSMSRGVDYGSLLFILQLTLMKRHSWIDLPRWRRLRITQHVVRGPNPSSLDVHLKSAEPVPLLFDERAMWLWKHQPNPCHPDRSEAKWRDLRCVFLPNKCSTKSGRKPCRWPHSSNRTICISYAITKMSVLIWEKTPTDRLIVCAVPDGTHLSRGNDLLAGDVND